MNRYLIVTAARRLVAASLALLVFWQVAQHAGARRAMAIVHVVATDVVVAVDDRAYPIESVAESPLVCELGTGEHVLRMRRGPRLVYEEKFTLRPGQELILAAYESHPNAAPGPGPRSRASGPSPALAIRTGHRAPARH
jgi:hypothetical protein